MAMASHMAEECVAERSVDGRSDVDDYQAKFARIANQSDADDESDHG
jgi:hypothetical protein